MTTATELRTLIRDFIQTRLKTKLEKLKPEEVDKRGELEATHEPEAWLADAARRAAQIQLATHTLKPLHPDARGSSLHVGLGPIPPGGLVSTQSIGSDRDDDVVGNAAALDVYKLLSLTVDGTRLLTLVLRRDPSVIQGLSDDASKALSWCEAFASIARNGSAPASHALAKQIYYPLSHGDYHLLERRTVRFRLQDAHAPLQG